MACLFVSSKVEDTIKKLKDIMMATYSYRHPEAADWDPESKVRPKGCHHVFFFFFFFFQPMLDATNALSHIAHPGLIE